MVRSEAARLGPAAISHLHEVENGRANPTLLTLCALTQILGVELAVGGVR